MPINVKIIIIKPVKTHTEFRSLSLQNHILYYVLLPIDQLLQVHVPPLYHLRRLAQLTQQHVRPVLHLSCQKLARIIGVVRHQQVEERRQLQSLDAVDVEAVRLDS